MATLIKLILATIVYLNNMKRLIYIIFLCWALLPHDSIQAQNLNQVSDTKKKFIRFYFEAERYKLLEEYEQALVEYKNCISVIPEESAPYYQIGKLYLYVFNDIANSEYYIKEAVSLDPKNTWFYYDLLTIYSIQNNNQQKQKIYDKLIEIEPEKQAYYFENIRSLIGLKEYRNAIRFIKKTEKKFGVSNESLMLLKDIYIDQNNLREAEKIGQKLAEKSAELNAVLAEIYMHFSEYEKAIITYNKLLDVFPNNPIAIVALYKIYANKGETLQEERYLSKIASNQNVSLEIKKEIFYQKLINNQFLEYQAFQKIIEDLVLIHPEEPLFHLILADIYAKDEQYQLAIDEYYLALYSGYIKDDYVYNKLVQMYWQQENIAELLKVALEAIERFPFSPEFYYYQGLAFATQDKHELCLEPLLKGKDYVFDNDLLKSDFYSLIGDAHHNLENHQESDKSYVKALKYNPNNMLVLNNYSYYLSKREENLSKAKEMIIKCLALSADNPNASYIDTYAWVLYKLGEYSLAREQIEKALLINNKSPVILDHYGDILHKLGMKEDALIYWTKSYELDSSNLKLKEKIINNSQNE